MMRCKRFLAMICCICITFCCGTSAFTTSPIEVTYKTRLSSLAKEECAQFLADMGVEIPEGIHEEFDYSVWIANFEEAPDENGHQFMGYTVTVDFLDEVKEAVRQYSRRPPPSERYISTGYAL